VGRQDDDAIPLAGELHDEVVHHERSDRRARSEPVVNEIPFGHLGRKVSLDEALSRGVAWRANVALGCSIHVLLSELEDGLTADGVSLGVRSGRERKRGA
jgi:hypothetical protein